MEAAGIEPASESSPLKASTMRSSYFNLILGPPYEQDAFRPAKVEFRARTLRHDARPIPICVALADPYGRGSVRRKLL